MNILLLGSSGMVGKGVLRECLTAYDVENIYAINRHLIPSDSNKVNNILCEDFSHISEVISDLPHIDACFFCLGQSSTGLSEQQYREITVDLTSNVTKSLVEKNAEMTFIFVSGSGSDTTEKGNVMWARIKGEAENAVLTSGFKNAYCFRPAIIQPLHGIQSKTSSYRIMYKLMTPIFPVLKKCFPNSILTTEDIGKAMLNVARNGYSNSILEVKDIKLAGSVSID